MTLAEMAWLHAQCFTLPRPWGEAELQSVLASPLAFLLPEEAGFLIGRVVADEAELLTLAVDPAARRQGCGSALLRGFLRVAAERGAARAILEVAESNGGARALYAAHGFDELGRRRGYYAASGSAPVDALILSREIGTTRPDPIKF